MKIPRTLLIGLAVLVAGTFLIIGIMLGHWAGVRDERNRTRPPISLLYQENFPCTEDQVLGYSDLSRTQVVCMNEE